MLAVLEEVTAGTVPTCGVTPGTATRIMTGAPLPAGATAVVMVEKTSLLGNKPDHVQLNESPRSGQNIVRQGTSLRSDETVLTAGQQLSPARIGLLAEVGRSEVRVAPLPTLAVLTTGNEIVPVGSVPKAGQIRNSNGPMLEALAKQLGIEVISLGAARDEEIDLRSLISRGLQADVLVISGGVSAGVLDLVPGVLTKLGVRQVFHKVNLKPGKPVWFGVFPREGGRQTLVFGLPGNPVSSFVCFELFVRHALSQLSAAAPLISQKARLTQEYAHRGERPTFWPATLEDAGDQREVKLLASKGSGDLKTLADADCLAFFPGPDRKYAVGEEVRAYLL